MSLPDRIDYALGAGEQLPTSRASWTLEPSRAALLVHDMQRYFLRIYDDACPALQDAIANTARLLQAARAAGIPVYYTAQTGTQHAIPRGLQGDLWGGGMSPITEHTAILDEVAPAARDTVLVKHRYDAFAHSDLGALLDDAGRDQLVICGVYAHIGILATSFTAFQREIQPFVVADGVADLSATAHHRALDQIASCTGVVLRADDVHDSFLGHTTRSTA